MTRVCAVRMSDQGQLKDNLTLNGETCIIERLELLSSNLAQMFITLRQCAAILFDQFQFKVKVKVQDKKIISSSMAGKVLK